MDRIKPKPVDASVLYELGKDSWKPRLLSNSSVPTWLRRHSFRVYASGDCSLPRIEEWDDKQFECVVGGIDVIRLDPKDFRHGVFWNADHYAITSSGLLQAYGPFKSGRDWQHWLHEIPEHLKSARALDIANLGRN